MSTDAFCGVYAGPRRIAMGAAFHSDNYHDRATSETPAISYNRAKTDRLLSCLVQWVGFALFMTQGHISDKETRKVFFNKGT